jgi:hypothetical protein
MWLTLTRKTLLLTKTITMMKQQTLLNKSRWLFVCFLSFMMTLGGTSSAWADNADFENTLPDGWEIAGTMSYYERPKTGNYSIGNSSYQGWDTNKGNYIKTTKLEGTVTFWIRSYASNKTGYVSLYALSDDGTTVGDKLTSFSSSSTAFAEKTYTLTEATRLAIVINYAHLDNMTYTPYIQVSGPALAVKDGSTTLTSPYAYNFGLATAGTTKVFTLSNPGSAAVEGLSVAKTGDFGATLSATSIAAGGEATLTVTMPEATGSSAITLSSTTDGIDDFVINVSGTVRDPNKVYETLLTGSIPDDWTTSGGTWSWSTTNGASNTAWYESSNYRLITPKLTVAEGETFFFDAQGTYSGYQGVKFEYSSDGTTWTASSTATAVSSDWQTFMINDIPAGNYYIALHGWHVNVRNFYGGELPNEPKMVVTQPASLSFGTVNKGAEALSKTFTIADTGKAALEGISVTSSNVAFTITNAPTSLAAGASQEVTITMSTANVDNLSSDITVSATGMEDVVFTVTGTVMPTGLSAIDFNDNQLPARWENTGWTFANGAAYAAYHNPAYVMTTPKIVVNAGDMFVVKGKIEYNSSSYYVTVKGLNSSSEEAYSKKLTSDVFNNSDYTAVLLSDVPATVEKLQFVGYYGYIDEIQGINYAASLSVTTGDPAVAVSSPANCDFGECAADATVTYNFANAGAGTINITNVAITGDGAAAYSTNWTTSVAAPFDLVITRTYDADRTAAQDAVVTVTTTEGDFVINVTGTDKAANAPELAVSTTAIDFGKVTADAVETVTVTNNGTGSMTVDIYSSSSDFTVTPAQLTGIGAGESKTFDITFKYGTPYGVKGGDVVVVPTYDPTKAQNITVTGKAKDPATWSEDFNDATGFPTGWVVTPGSSSSESYVWHLSSLTNYENKTKMAIAPTSSNSNTIITPRLAAKENDVLAWDAYFYWYDEAMTVEWSNDGETGWTKIYEYKPQDDGVSTNYYHKAMSFTAPADGNYYLRFTSRYSNGIDNFEGFKLNLPDHIMAITASSIPTSGSYSPSMKATKSFNASVTVKELRGVAEAGVVAKFYMGTEVIGTSEPTDFAANQSKVLNITATPTTAATEGVQMHIEVEYAGGTLSTDLVTRYVAEFVRLDMTENSEPTITTGYSAVYDIVTLTRNFSAGWNTFVAPLAVNTSELGDGAKVYSFTGYDEGNLTFSVVSSGSLTAATPYIIYVPQAINNKVFTWETPVIYSSYVGTENIRSTHNSAIFQGTYAPIVAGGWTKSADTDVIYGVTSAGKIQKAGASATMKGFRAYFDLPAGATARLAIYDEATGITTILDAKELNNDGKVYNLNGQRVENAHKGLYIVNGKKVIVK